MPIKGSSESIFPQGMLTRSKAPVGQYIIHLHTLGQLFLQTFVYIVEIVEIIEISIYASPSHNPNLTGQWHLNPIGYQTYDTEY